MSEGTNLAKAYVQIVPSMKGIKNELSGMLGSEVDGPSKEAGSHAGSNIAGKIKSAIAAAGIGVALKELVGSALSEGSALQQSIGGIETLFGAGGAKSVQEYADSVGKSVSEVQDTYDSLKASEEKMLSYADGAWKTAGLSANAYMETSTSIAASLLSSLNGDTNAAADAANNAVIAMADNANKMGTDMQSIQNAYQGFAKGNYTMLDNLKLGYGGTKEEMERLLSDAEKLSGVHYDINNLADVYNAVSVIQDNLGITGTTAKEAATTFTGSMAGMKAAAQNLLGNLAIGQDIGPSLTALSESVQTFVVGNLLPMLGNIFSALPGLAGSLVGFAQELLVSLLGQLPQFLQAGMQVIEALLSGIGQALPSVIPAAVQAVSELAVGLLSNLDLVLGAALELIKGLASGILSALPVLISALPLVISGICDFLVSAVPMIIETGIMLITSLVSALPVIIENICSAIPLIISGVISTALNLIPLITNCGIELLVSLISALPTIVTTICSAIPTLISSLIDTLIGSVGQIASTGVTLLVSIIENLPVIIVEICKAVPQIIAGIVSAFGGLIGEIVSVGGNIVSGLWQGLTGSLDWLKQKIKGWVGDVLKFIKGLFGIHSPSAVMRDQIGKFLPSGIAVGVDANAHLVDDAFRNMAGQIDTETSFSPVLERALSADGFGFSDMPGTDAEPMQENGRSEELLEQILEILVQLLALYNGKPDGGGSVDELLIYLDQRLGRISAMKARGV